MAQPRVFKPVGADQYGLFPDRVVAKLDLAYTPLSSVSADYVVSKSGSTISAKARGGSGLSDYSGTDASVVIQSAINALTPAGGAGSSGGHIYISRGVYFLNAELTINGWEASSNPFSQLKITGDGASSIFTQNTAGQNGIVVKNAASVSLRDFRVYAGSNAKSGLLFDSNGSTSEISTYKSVIDNVRVDSNSTGYPAVHLKNFFDLSIGMLHAWNPSNHGLVLENASTTTNYGNSHFAFISVTASTSAPYAGLDIRTSGANHFLNLISIGHFECVGGGYYGIRSVGLHYSRFGFVDIEGILKPVFFDGTSSGEYSETRGVSITDGYIQPTNTGTAITNTVYTGGNKISATLGVGGSAVPILDQQASRPKNSYDLNITSTTESARSSISDAGTPVTWRYATGAVVTLPSTAVADATTSAKGILQLGGDLGGTASAPTVPALATKADLVGGVVPVSQIPSIAVTDYLGPSANQAAMLALVGQKGDWTLRSDLGTNWVITGSDPTQLSSWTALTYPAAPVTSVAGRSGAVTLAKADVTGIDQVDNTSDINKPISTATQNALNAKAALATISDPAWQQTAADTVSVSSPLQYFHTRPQRQPSKVVYRFNGASGWTGTGLSEDLTTTLFGDRTLKFSASNGTGIGVDSPVFTPQNWSTSIMRFWLKVDNPANYVQGIIYIYMANGGIVNAGISGNFIANEWNPVTMNRSMFGTAAGTPDWTQVNKITIQSNPAASSTLVTWIGGIDLIPDLSAVYPGGVMMIEMDDGYAGQITNGLPVLSSRGIPVTYNIIAERFIPTPSISATGKYAADLRQLQDVHGWQIACHAYATAAHGSSVNSVATMEADFQRQKQWLHANGLHGGVDHYALCPGTGSPVSQGAMFNALEKSFKSIRVNSGFFETAIPGDPLRLRSILFSGAGNNVNNLKANIDKAAGAGGALILAMHDVIAGATDGTSNGLAAIGATNLATVVDYALGKGMVFRTRADFIEGR